MVQIQEDVKEKVKSLLREMFRFDSQDLDFGIYRIMNFKRKAVENFIENDFIIEAEERFSSYNENASSEYLKMVEDLKNEIRRDFGADTIDDQGNVIKHSDTPKVQEYIKKYKQLSEKKISAAQINDVLNHIFEFFSRYYDKGDFNSKRRYGGREKYYLPYNGEEMVLYWANKDQYYVKTAEFFNNYHFIAGDYRINFLLKDAKVDLNNNLGDDKYFFLRSSDFLTINDEKRIIDISFEYRWPTVDEKRELGLRNLQETLASLAIERIFLKINGCQVAESLKIKGDDGYTVLEKQIYDYVRKNTSDYFVHKNLRAFLERELEFYVKNEILNFDELKEMEGKVFNLTMAKVKTIQEISAKIIEFLAQIEEFQKLLFEKKKFVTKTEYVITLDKIKEYSSSNFLESITNEILQNKAQLLEWEEQQGIAVKEKKDLIERHVIDGEIWKKLPIDTKNFGSNFKFKLLSELTVKNSLDEIIDGVLVKSENWQALNLLLHKFQEKVKCIYIDPPFNTGTNEFLYKNTFLDSSWATMIYDRLSLAKKYLSDDGCIYVRIDYHGNHIVRLVMDSLFGKNNFRNELIARRGRSKAGLLGQFEDIKSLAVAYDNLYWYSKKEDMRFAKFWKEASDEQKESGKWHSFYKDSPNRPKMQYELLGVKINRGQWKRGKDRAFAAVKNYSEYLEANKTTKETLEQYWSRKGGNMEFVRKEDSGTIKFWVPPREKILRDNDWLVIPGYANGWEFETENSETIVQQSIEPTTNKGDLIMDFFLGSGTSAAVAQKLHRKWIGIEMGNYFDNIPLKRMKAVLAGDESGISKETGWTGGGFFKYHYIEQYEDTLSNIVFVEKDKTVQETLETFGDYFVRYMLDYETKGSPSRLSLEGLQAPFDYKIWVLSNGEKRLSPVDLIETYVYLAGIKINTIRVFNDNEKEYCLTTGKCGDESIAVIWRSSKGIDLIRDKEFIEKIVLAGKSYDRILINGDSLVANAEQIGPDFKSLMGA